MPRGKKKVVRRKKAVRNEPHVHVLDLNQALGGIDKALQDASSRQAELDRKGTRLQVSTRLLQGILASSASYGTSRSEEIAVALAYADQLIEAVGKETTPEAVKLNGQVAETMAAPQPVAVAVVVPSPAPTAS